MSHRFLLRLVTNLAVFLLALSCFGIVLWVTDEILGWDILPDTWSLIVRALLVAGGIVGFVLLVMNAMLSLALLAEANASRAKLPDYTISSRFKRRVRKSMVAGVIAIVLLIGGLQVVNQVRAQAAMRMAQAEFNQAQADMDQSVEQVLGLFTPPLLEAIDNNMLAEKGQLGNLSKLFSSIQASFPHQPATALLLPATQAPYKYVRITIDSINADDEGRLSLTPQLYTGFPTEEETQAIEQLFSGEPPSLQAPLRGSVINNTEPSSWGILKRDGRAIAVVYLRGDAFAIFERPILTRSFHHDGPDSLLTN